MAYKRRDAHVILVHTHEPPTDVEWQACARDVEQWWPEVIGYLIVTAGGGPTGAQRRLMRAMQDRLQQPSVRVAVVCESLLTRGIVKALGLFNSKIQAFRPDAMQEALIHIGAALHGDAVLAELEQLRMRLR